MFEAGRSYRVTYTVKDDGGTGDSLSAKVLEVVDSSEGLVKFKKAGGNEIIVNTNSSGFVSAEPIS